MSDLPSIWCRGSDGPPLVFLHGLGGDHSYWRYQMKHFGRTRRCIAWDMPGYGASPPPWEMSFPVLATTLRDLLDALGLAKVHLVGQSLGGMIAQEFALAFPDRLASLALCATTAAFARGDGEFQRRFVADRLGPLDDGHSMAELAPVHVRRVMHPGADPEAVQIAIGCMSNVPVPSYRAATQMIAGFDRRDAIARIACPTLLVAGEQDAVAPVAAMQRMAERIKGARLVTIAGAGHLVNLERPHEFDAALEAFLAGVGGG